MIRITALSVCLVFACVTSIAQEFQAPKPGPEHEMLKKMVGKWDAVVKSGGMESKGSQIYEMTLGGLWLEGRFETELGGEKFSGKGLDSYDATKKKYISVWVDSMTTTPLIFEGDFDKEKKTLTMMANGTGPDGSEMKFTSTTTMKDDDHMTFVLKAGEKENEMEMIAIEYTRRKK